jgi:hypothetical protein
MKNGQFLKAVNSINEIENSEFANKMQQKKKEKDQLVEKNIGGLEDRVRVETQTRRVLLAGLVFPLRHAIELPRRRNTAQDPGQFSVLRHLTPSIKQIIFDCKSSIIPYFSYNYPHYHYHDHSPPKKQIRIISNNYNTSILSRNLPIYCFKLIFK